MNTVTNLRKLADYIEQHVRQDQLEMRWYRSDKKRAEAEYRVPRLIAFKSHTDCGTCGCALGWAPFVEGLEPIDDDACELEETLDFGLYARRIFPDLYEEAPFMSGAHYATADWDDVFTASLSSEKPEVIQRLRDKANYLEKRL